MQKMEFKNQSVIGKRATRAVGARLTFREREILHYVANGNRNRQIASILKISEQTVKNRMTAILRKLNANDRAHATFIAIRSGLI